MLLQSPLLLAIYSLILLFRCLDVYCHMWGSEKERKMQHLTPFLSFAPVFFSSFPISSKYSHPSLPAFTTGKLLCVCCSQKCWLLCHFRPHRLCLRHELVRRRQDFDFGRRKFSAATTLVTPRQHPQLPWPHPRRPLVFVHDGGNSVAAASAAYGITSAALSTSRYLVWDGLRPRRHPVFLSAASTSSPPCPRRWSSACIPWPRVQWRPQPDIARDRSAGVRGFPPSHHPRAPPLLARYGVRDRPGEGRSCGSTTSAAPAPPTTPLPLISAMPSSPPTIIHLSLSPSRPRPYRPAAPLSLPPSTPSCPGVRLPGTAAIDLLGGGLLVGKRHVQQNDSFYICGPRRQVDGRPVASPPKRGAGRRDAGSRWRLFEILEIGSHRKTHYFSKVHTVRHTLQILYIVFT